MSVLSQQWEFSAPEHPLAQPAPLLVVEAEGEVVGDPQLPVQLPGALAVLEGLPAQELLQPHAHLPRDWVLEDEGLLEEEGDLEQLLLQVPVPLLGVLAVLDELPVHVVELEDEGLLGEEGDVDLLLPEEAKEVAFAQAVVEEGDPLLGEGEIQVGRPYL